jgi:hypothetical protein
MGDWIKLGDRYVNVEQINEVRVHRQLHSMHVFFVGGAVLELRDEDADDLEAMITQKASIPESESHRRVFAPGEH